MAVKGFEKISRLESRRADDIGKKPVLVIDQDLASTQLIGLGEIASGNSELQALAAEVVLGLSAKSEKPLQILVDAPNYSLAKAAKKIAWGEAVDVADLAGVNRLWQSAGFLKTLNLFAKANKKKAGTIELRGFDIRQPIEEFKVLSEIYPGLPLLAKFNDAEYCKNFERSAMEPEKFPGAKAEIWSLTTELDDIEKSLKNKSPAVQRAHRMLKLWIAIYSNVEKDLSRSHAARDTAMFEIIKEATANKKQTVIWARLGHLMYSSRELASSLDYINGIDVLGTLIKKTFGPNYKLVGLAAKTVNLQIKGQPGMVMKVTAESFESRLEPMDFYRIDRPAFQAKEPIILGRTGASGPEKETYPEFIMTTPQLDYLLMDYST